MLVSSGVDLCDIRSVGISPWTVFDKVVDRRIVREELVFPVTAGRGVLVSPGTLSNKRHWLASERSVAQQVCEVSGRSD